jgi:hypothetical protein
MRKEISPLSPFLAHSAGPPRPLLPLFPPLARASAIFPSPGPTRSVAQLPVHPAVARPAQRATSAQLRAASPALQPVVAQPQRARPRIARGAPAAAAAQWGPRARTPLFIFLCGSSCSFFAHDASKTARAPRPVRRSPLRHRRRRSRAPLVVSRRRVVLPR